VVQPHRALIQGSARVAGSARPRSATGVFELESGGDPLPDGRVRVLGGGRCAEFDEHVLVTGVRIDRVQRL
jgi:hypothetical protein